MKICYALRHVPFESLGLLEPLLVERGLVVRYVEVPRASLPRVELEAAELVVVLGGPISAYEDTSYPFLADELKILETRLKHSKATIGICLGAQLIARALGARVYPGTDKEIGWARLRFTAEGNSHALSAVGEHRVLHWHGDTFDLPNGAVLLASTKTTPNQAFAWLNSTIALQFHLEAEVADLEAWYVGHTLELSRWGKVAIPELRAAGRMFAPLLEPQARRVLGTMLDTLLQ